MAVGMQRVLLIVIRFITALLAPGIHCSRGYTEMACSAGRNSTRTRPVYSFDSINYTRYYVVLPATSGTNLPFPQQSALLLLHTHPGVIHDLGNLDNFRFRFLVRVFTSAGILSPARVEELFC